METVSRQQGLSPNTPAAPVAAVASASKHRRQVDRRRTLSTLVCTALFTAVQAWSMLVILLGAHAGGVLTVALACTLAGAVTAVASAWRRVL
jgi:hypothetical protein